MTDTADMQAVVFNLASETFALPVGTVREILDHRAPFRVPQGPAWFAGLIDVRGEAVPIVDLRVRLGLAPAEIGLTTRILVIDVRIEARSVILGLIVDKVLDVASFAASAIETTPDIGVRWRSDYMDGVVRQQDGFVVLLAAANIFSADDASALSSLDRAA